MHRFCGFYYPLLSPLVLLSFCLFSFCLEAWAQYKLSPIQRAFLLHYALSVGLKIRQKLLFARDATIL